MHHSLETLSSYNHFHNILKLSPQVKQCAIITYKHGIYELPQKLNFSTVTYPEFFWGHRFQQGVWVHGKVLVGAQGAKPLEASGI